MKNDIFFYCRFLPIRVYIHTNVLSCKVVGLRNMPLDEHIETEAHNIHDFKNTIKTISILCFFKYMHKLPLPHNYLLYSFFNIEIGKLFFILFKLYVLVG